jgi:hypothetical protein
MTNAMQTMLGERNYIWPNFSLDEGVWILVLSKQC